MFETDQSKHHTVGQRVMMHSLVQTALMAPRPEIAALLTLLGELFIIPDSTASLF
ncbi:hypothetical protein [Mycobacterium lepromatosis]|uniref:hypothetical protein n=1 Tax=Mycobacterium lepromatosis TaxID=480418 RepID=UPI001EDAAE5F|nr:hypothetical protein [Mycobacterium lepromatosis]